MNERTDKYVIFSQHSAGGVIRYFEAKEELFVSSSTHLNNAKLFYGNEAVLEYLNKFLNVGIDRDKWSIKPVKIVDSYNGNEIYGNIAIKHV